MTANRIDGFWKEGVAQENTGFTVNPFGPGMPAWQAAMYEAAFMQALKELEKETRPGFPWAESLN